MANPAPVGYYVTPRIQPAAGGEIMQLVGRDLDPTSIVITTGGNPTSPKSVSRFLCNYASPPHIAGVVSVVVTTADGGFTLTNAITYV